MHACVHAHTSVGLWACLSVYGRVSMSDCVCIDVHLYVCLWVYLSAQIYVYVWTCMCLCVCKTQGSAKSWGPSTHMEYDRAGSAHRTKPQLAWRIQEAPQLRDFQGPRRTRSSKVSPLAKRNLCFLDHIGKCSSNISTPAPCCPPLWGSPFWYLTLLGVPPL